MSQSHATEKVGGAPSSQTKAATQSNVLARLQALFPSSGQTGHQGAAAVGQGTVTADMIDVEQDAKPNADPDSEMSPHFLKIRIVTWNMHDSLPKGNLEDLLGIVPHYEPLPEGGNDGSSVPKLAMEDCHPYHVVVVAGQECPTVSGIPMGLAAAFKHKEEKHKEEEKKQSKAQMVDIKEPDEPRDRETLHAPPLSNDTTSSSSAASSSTTHVHNSGWSWILEEWFCHGLGESGENTGTQSVYELYRDQANDMAISNELDGHLNEPSGSRVDTTEIKDQKKQKYKKQKERRGKNTGPYELFVKERLMGIYIAVFIYRDLKPLVRNFSKSTVAAGLIGGRVGNKGGVGVSIDIAGKTLLFVNAHLAAHEDRVMHRVANMNKIKSELQVNDFLSQDDNRLMSEDITEKFDYTFIFGDLNFRLNVSRLHADWLIGRKEYNQALAFDQLRELIRGGKAFVGFKEGPINFPPTFKYDIARGLKRERSQLSQEIMRRRESRENKQRHGQSSHFNLPEVQEVESELADREDEYAKSVDDLREPRRSASVYTDDNQSTISTTTTTTSVHSRATLAEYDSAAINTTQVPGGEAKNVMHAIQHEILTKMASKAKDKWLAIVRQKEPRPQLRRSVSRKRYRDFAASTPHISLAAQSGRTDAINSSIELDASPGRDAGSSPSPGPGFLDDLRRASSKRSKASGKHEGKSFSGSSGAAGKAPETNEAETSCYDSSSKKRVPSWCDRILWKSTVPVEPESDDEEEDSLNVDQRSGLGPRMMQFLAQALKPLSTRTRALSLSSADVANPVVSTPPRHSKFPARAITVSPDSQLQGISAVRMEQKGASPKRTSSPRFASTRLKRSQPPKFGKSKSIEPATSTPLLDVGFRKRGRTQSVQISAPIVDSPTVELGETGSDGIMQPSLLHPDEPRQHDEVRQHMTSGKSWRFFPFISREGESVPDIETQKTDSEPSTKPALPKHSRRPRKGEVIVLGYRSLDDQAMRRLEGRSDHRPVIGSYAIII